MASSKSSLNLLSTILLLSLLLLAFGRVAEVEARMCSTPSQRFHGACLSDRNCASVCSSEGFPSGDCHGVLRRCMCLKPCPAEN
ncbi:unnamed protein product [Victoria cruziana]